jgi:hypothetical protein
MIGQTYRDEKVSLESYDMSELRQISLAAVRTDGWFERIGETIGSFQALCDILGPRFFAFAMITGARITALTVDRRVPDNTMVDFTVGEESENGESQRVTLSEFRKRLVASLVKDETIPNAPERDNDVEGMQQHIGVRYLLLAPLFGYVLQTLHVEGDGSRLELIHDGVEESHLLSAFRARLRTHVRQEHERVSRGQGDGAIDLGRVAEADDAATAGDHRRVAELLGAWPAPLAIFLRTAEGQALGHEARVTVARGLGLLGSACVEFGEFDKAEEILRLAVQYAGEGPSAGDVYYRLGLALLVHGRAGEAIGPLRRGVALGAIDPGLWPALGRAFLERDRNLAALAVSVAALRRGVADELLRPIQEQATARLGWASDSWRKFLDESGSGRPNPTLERLPESER